MEIFLSESQFLCGLPTILQKRRSKVWKSYVLLMLTELLDKYWSKSPYFKHTILINFVFKGSCIVLLWFTRNKQKNMGKADYFMLTGVIFQGHKVSLSIWAIWTGGQIKITWFFKREGIGTFILRCFWVFEIKDLPF